MSTRRATSTTSNSSLEIDTKAAKKSEEFTMDNLREAVISKDKAKLLKYGKSFNKPILEQPDVTVDENIQQIFSMIQQKDHPHLGPIILDLASKL